MNHPSPRLGWWGWGVFHHPRAALKVALYIRLAHQDPRCVAVNGDVLRLLLVLRGMSECMLVSVFALYRASKRHNTAGRAAWILAAMYNSCTLVIPTELALIRVYRAAILNVTGALDQPVSPTDLTLDIHVHHQTTCKRVWCISRHTHDKGHCAG